jgi:hypothetical protein
MFNVSRPVVSLLASLSFVLSLASLAIVVLANEADAQTTDVIGVRAQGMGGAFTAVADDATAWWWNPAGLAGGPLFNAVVEFDRPNTSVSDTVRGVSVAYPALGATYYRLPLRQIRLSASTESSAKIREDDEAALRVYGATIGQSFGNHLVLGSTLKLLNADDTNATLDIGVMTTFGALRIGAVVRDVTEPSFRNEGGQYEFKLERSARAGFALSSGRRGVIGSATLSVDADLTTTHDPLLGDERMLAFGVEAWSQRSRIGVRGGLNSNRAADQGVQVSGGVSFAIRSGSFVDAFISGGGDDVRHGWGFTLRLTF